MQSLLYPQQIFGVTFLKNSIIFYQLDEINELVYRGHLWRIQYIRHNFISISIFKMIESHH